MTLAASAGACARERRRPSIRLGAARWLWGPRWQTGGGWGGGGGGGVAAGGAGAADGGSTTSGGGALLGLVASSSSSGSSVGAGWGAIRRRPLLPSSSSRLLSHRLARHWRQSVVLAAVAACALVNLFVFLVNVGSLTLEPPTLVAWGDASTAAAAAAAPGGVGGAGAGAATAAGDAHGGRGGGGGVGGTSAKVLSVYHHPGGDGGGVKGVGSGDAASAGRLAPPSAKVAFGIGQRRGSGVGGGDGGISAGVAHHDVGGGVLSSAIASLRDAIGKEGAAEKMWVQAVRLRSRLSGPTPHDDLVLTYALPSRIAEALSPAAATALLHQLTLMDVLRAHASGSATVEPSRLLILHAQNGLGNRLRVLASGLAMARASLRVPLLVWERDAHMGAHYGQLFEEGHPSSGGVATLFSSLAVVDRFPAWCDVATAAAEAPDAFTAFNHMDKELGGGHSARPAIAANSAVLRRRHIYVKSAYVLAASPPLRVAAINAEARLLTPVPAVRRLMATRVPAGLDRMVGVHVRSRRLARDSAAVDASCEYSVASAATTDGWRNASQAPAFAAEMAVVAAAAPSTHFFVAVDDAALADALADAFPGRTHGLTRSCDDRGPSCMRYALVDMLALARTRMLLGSNWSSFTEMAGRLAPSGQVVRLSGVHFGRRRLYWRDRLAAVAADVWRLVRRRFVSPPAAALYSGCRQRLETGGTAAA